MLAIGGAYGDSSAEKLVFGSPGVIIFCSVILSGRRGLELLEKVSSSLLKPLSAIGGLELNQQGAKVLIRLGHAVLGAIFGFEFVRILSAKVILHDGIADDHVAQQDFLGAVLRDTAADSDKKDQAHERVSQTHGGRRACGAGFAHAWEQSYHDVVLANASSPVATAAIFIPRRLIEDEGESIVFPRQCTEYCNPEVFAAARLRGSCTTDSGLRPRGRWAWLVGSRRTGAGRGRRSLGGCAARRTSFGAMSNMGREFCRRV